MTIKQAEQVIKLLDSIDIELSMVDIIEFDNIDDLEEYLQENSHLDVDIIYYSKAMEYLSEHDNSLFDSLALASDIGFELKNLNSETLASLLASENLKEEFYNIKNELEEVLE